MNLPSGTCGCGCGKPTRSAPRRNAKKGYVRGQPMPFLRGHNRPRLVEARFWTKVRKGSGCWEWVGSRNDEWYGNFFYRGRVDKAHRAAYEIQIGPIPHGLNVLHRCDNPPCVRGEHLFLGTLSDNTQDALRKGRLRAGERNAAKAHCANGHPYEGGNIIWRASNGSRECRICHYAAMVRYRNRRRQTVAS